MIIHDVLRNRRAFAPETESGAPAEASGSAAPPAADPPAGDPSPPSAKWYEAEAFTPLDPWLTSKGMKVDDPLDALSRAVRVAQGAEKLLGRGVERLIEKPVDGSNVAEWMRANAAVLGLPEAADQYTIDKPEMPEGVKWDEAFEAAAREIAFEHAIPPAAFQAMVSAYGEKIAGLFGDAGVQAQAANAEMMQGLEAAWGDKTGARIAQAQAAARALAEKAGLDSEALAGVVQALTPKTGDAGVMKMFAAIGEMMGEDSLKGGGAAPGGFAGGNTPQEARARLAAMDAPDGEFGRAFRADNKAEMARLKPIRDALIKIAAGG